MKRAHIASLSASILAATMFAKVSRFVSWIVLLSMLLVAMGVAVAALSGRLVLDPMWIVLSLILAVVFLPDAGRVRWDLAGDRASLQTHRHRHQLR
jgi:hypothetical protein